MATCDVCGNDYDKAMTIDAPGRGSGTFDSFECAIHALAPACSHCGCKIIGHGVESPGSTFSAQTRPSAGMLVASQFIPPLVVRNIHTVGKEVDA